MAVLALAEYVNADIVAETQSPSWLHDLRAQAQQSLQAHGLPAEGSENWRYSSLRSLLRKPLSVSTDVIVDEQQLLSLVALEKDDFRMVFVNGLYQAQLSLVPVDIQISSLATELKQQDLSAYLTPLPEAVDAGFSWLNASRFEDGLYIKLGDNQVVEQTIHLIQLSVSDVLSHGRHIIDLGADSRLSLNEHFVDFSGVAAGGLLNTQMHILVGKNARMDWTRTQALGSKSMLVDRVDCQLSAGAELHCTHLDVGGLWIRHDFNVELQGEHGFIQVDGVVLVRGRQHTDFHTRIDHQVENCTSRENFKCIADGRGRGVYNGKILVQPGADGSDSAQKSANLLLSPHAEINTKPDLEILADDVVASHGATVGQLDEDALYYMRTRGIDVPLGRRMLMRAFCQEVIDRVKAPVARAQLSSKLDQVFAEMEII